MAKTTPLPVNKFEQAVRMVKEGASFFEIEAMVKSGLQDLKVAMEQKAAGDEEAAVRGADSGAEEAQV